MTVAPGIKQLKWNTRAAVWAPSTNFMGSWSATKQTKSGRGSQPWLQPEYFRPGYTRGHANQTNLKDKTVPEAHSGSLSGRPVITGSGSRRTSLRLETSRPQGEAPAPKPIGPWAGEEQRIQSRNEFVCPMRVVMFWWETAISSVPVFYFSSSVLVMVNFLSEADVISLQYKVWVDGQEAERRDLGYWQVKPYKTAEMDQLSQGSLSWSERTTGARLYPAWEMDCHCLELFKVAFNVPGRALKIPPREPAQKKKEREPASQSLGLQVKTIKRV